MLPLAARQPAKCIPELCTRHTSPGSPRNPSPERERAGGSAAAAEVTFAPPSSPQQLGCSLQCTPPRASVQSGANVLNLDSAVLPVPSRAAKGSAAKAFKTKRMNGSARASARDSHGEAPLAWSKSGHRPACSAPKLAGDARWVLSGLPISPLLRPGLSRFCTLPLTGTI